MKVRKLKLEGALEFTPPHPDRRGKLLVPYDEQVFAEAVGYSLRLGQVNHAVSRKGTIRGLHFAQVLPSPRVRRRSLRPRAGAALAG